MHNARVNYGVVGLFVLLVLGALIGTLAVLAGRTGTLDTYHVVFENVMGVKYGTQVTFEGFRIGQVEGIDPIRVEGDLRYRVNMGVQEGWPIPEDSEGVITAPSFLAPMMVDIRAGSSPVRLPPGSVIAAGPAANMYMAMNSVAGEFGDLSKTALRPLLEELRLTLDSLGVAVKNSGPELIGNLTTISREFAERSPAIAANVEAFTGGLPGFVDNDNQAQMDRLLANLEQASASMATVAAQLETTRRRADGLLTEVGGVVAGVNGVVSNVNGLVADNRDTLEGALTDLRYSLRTIARHVDTTAQNMEGTSRNMYELSRDLRQNPGLLLQSNPPAEGPVGGR